MSEKDIDKICNICKREIHIKKDSYVKVEDYKEGKYYDTGYYHNKCYLYKINTGTSLQTKALIKMVSSLAGRADKMLKEAGYEEKVTLESDGR